MIKQIQELDKITINVKLKSGELFTNKDIPNMLFGSNETYVAFWHNDRIRIYPLEEVEYVEMIPNDSDV